jgi:nicotinamide-nucleotide amidase
VDITVESIAIGDELLDGRVLDGNSKGLGDALSVLGLELTRTTIVNDDRATIAEAVREASARATLIVTSGGLGPTTDDVTAEAIALAAGTDLRLDEDALARVTAMFAARNLPMPDNNRRQAMLPRTSRTLPNAQGTAPGFVTPVGGAFVWSFPGVPREYTHLLEEHLLPVLRARMQSRNQAVVRRTIRTIGIGESTVGERLAAFEKAHPDVRVQYRVFYPENLVRLVVGGPDATIADARADALVEEARAAIGRSAYAIGDTSIEERVVHLLVERGETVSVAESCTGGLIAKRLTDVPGSSKAFRGGVVAYANEAKSELLDVDAKLIERDGAVSEGVAKALAEGAQKRLHATWALSSTGIAGPAGGSLDKPVGTVWLGVAGPSGVRAEKKKLPDFGRERIRELATALSLAWLLEELEGKSDSTTRGGVAS